MKNLGIVCLFVFFLTFIYIVNVNGARSCYSCHGKCSTMDVEQCPEDEHNICLSRAYFSNDTIYFSKECVPDTYGTSSFCEDLDNKPNYTCYTCDEDLCNDKVDINAGAKKCYSCNGTCNDPLDQEECPDLDGTDYVCMSSEITINRTTTISIKGCYPETVVESCKKVDELQLAWCSICDKDLCNAQDDRNVVKKCYSCHGICNSPMDLEECPSEDKNEYVCMSSVTTSSNTKENSTMIIKGCYPKTVTPVCNETNKAHETSCYTCGEDLCNYNNGVRECYFCNGTCKYPLEQEECPTSDGIDYICMTIKILKDNNVVETRGCFPSHDESCTNTTELDGNSCYTCNEDLCNNIDDNSDNAAEMYSTSFFFSSLTCLLIKIF